MSSVSKDDLFAAFDDAVEEDGFAIKGYEIYGELDRGGMAIVYHALQLNPLREVALKVMLPKFAGEEAMRERFQREARAMAALDFPGVMPIYQVGEADGMPFFTMKLAEGGTLAERLVHQDSFSFRELAEWMIGIAQAVHHAHLNGVLHRDLKPGNFLFDGAGQVLVADFGVASMNLENERNLTRTEAMVGTPNYLAPEVASGETPRGSVASDLYGLGATFYEGLTGQRPHQKHGGNMASLLRAIVDEPIVPVRQLNPKVPLDLAVICDKALQAHPQHRYDSVAAFGKDLERWTQGKVIEARPTAMWERTWRWSKRHPLPATLYVLLGLLLLAGVALQTFHLQEKSELLQDSYVDAAQSQRLLAAPGFRERALSFLQRAKDEGAEASAPALINQAVAALAKTDVVRLDQIAAEDVGWLPDGVRQTRRGGKWTLALTTQSGEAVLYRGRTEVERWRPRPGEIVSGDWLVPGKAFVLAGHREQAEVFGGDGFRDRSLFQPTISSRWLLAVGEKRVLLGGTDGLVRQGIEGEKSDSELKLREAIPRCAPAVGLEGAVVASVCGDDRSVWVQSVDYGSQIQRIMVSDWATHLCFSKSYPCLAVVTADQNVSLFDWLTGQRLGQFPSGLRSEVRKVWCEGPGTGRFVVEGLDGERTGFQIVPPEGFREWQRGVQDQGALELATGYRAKISPGAGNWILLTSSAGLEVWDTQSGTRADHYFAENQRLDAETQAWWLGPDGDRIFVSVPGAWEELTINEAGKITEIRQLDRIPGVVVLDIEPQGDWVVTVLDEDDGQTVERWPNGNEMLAEAAFPPKLLPEVGFTADVLSGGVIQVTEPWPVKLTLPQSKEVLQVLWLAQNQRVVVVTQDGNLAEWDLLELKRILRERGFEPGVW